MSWKATAYVKELRITPSGARLTTGEKLFLFVLADYHHTKRDIIWPSQRTLAEESLCTERGLRLMVASLVAKGVILVETFQGRGQTAVYRFAAKLTDDEPTPASPMRKTKPEASSAFDLEAVDEETGTKPELESTKTGTKPELRDSAIRKNRLTGEPVSTKPCVQAPPDTPADVPQKSKTPPAGEPELTLHGKIRKAIQITHEKRFEAKVQWDGSEAKILTGIVECNPSWDWAVWKRLILNRYRSDAINGERPRKWLPDIGRYAAGPLDRFGRPLDDSAARPPGSAPPTDDAGFENPGMARLRSEADERRRAIAARAAKTAGGVA